MTTQMAKVIKESYRRNFNINETMDVLKQQRTWMASWGFNSPVNYESKCLFFKVNGRHHKGIILITLDWMDTYVITLVNRLGRVIKVIENVYFDELSERIDVEVERIESYKR